MLRPLESDSDRDRKPLLPLSVVSFHSFPTFSIFWLVLHEMASFLPSILTLLLLPFAESSFLLCVYLPPLPPFAPPHPHAMMMKENHVTALKGNTEPE